MQQKYFYWIFIYMLLSGCGKKSDVIEYKPIGYFSSGYTLKTGAPRQGILKPETKGVIILDTIYTQGLSCLDEFEYIWGTMMKITLPTVW